MCQPHVRPQDTEQRRESRCAKRLLPVSLILAVALCLPTTACAKRAFRSMGESIRDAGLVVIADTAKGGERGFDTVITFREVLKGAPPLAGNTLTCPLSARDMELSLPREAKGIAVLLTKDWEKDQRPILEVYQTAEEIEALRGLVKIYEKKTERERLDALRQCFDDKNPLYRQQLFADLAVMREPANFTVLSDLYKTADAPAQRELVKLMEQMGEPRGLPTLLEALKSPDEGVSGAAAAALASSFPGAPGVTEAFRAAWPREHLRPTLLRYLAKRDPALKPDLLAQRKPFQIAREMEEAGDPKAARPQWMAMVEDEKSPNFARLHAAERLVEALNAEENAHVRKVLLPLLEHCSEAGNYLEMETCAKILRGLRRPDCLNALLKILAKQPDSLYRGSGKVALLAVCDLGPAARAKAFDVLAGRTTAVRKGLTEEVAELFSMLAWLGDEASYSAVDQTLDKRTRESLGRVGCWALQGLRTCPDEGAFLVSVLKAWSRPQTPVTELVIFRLGDLREKRAVEALVQRLVMESWPREAYAVPQALVKIGGREVEQAVLPLLTHKDENWVRREAIEILVALQGARALPLLRRMLTEKDFGVPASALMHLATLGTPEDLPLLLPLSDFWKADRPVQTWARSAVVSIRERYDYDVNGLIKVESQP